jgi:hypothetical protein
MVGGEYQGCIVPLPALLEQGDQVPEALVNTGAALMILGDFGAALGGVRKEGGDLDLGRVIEHFVDPLMRFPVGSVPEEVGLELQIGGSINSATAVGI